MSILQNIYDQVGQKAPKRKYRDALFSILGEYQEPEYDDSASFGEVSNGVDAGDMYFFSYQATKPEKLKYYDIYPLTYITSVNKDGFMGANMHYLKPKLREAVASSLINNADGVIVPNSTIHRYYFEGVQSQIMKVPESEMADVSMLPVEEFIDTKIGTQYPSYKVWRVG
tara:strand:+ start:89 stop:598 length:510 start_codon:yes stop_codon:yes gene_type:complete